MAKWRSCRCANDAEKVEEEEAGALADGEEDGAAEGADMAAVESNGIRKISTN
jgi:hypothetical protein